MLYGKVILYLLGTYKLLFRGKGFLSIFALFMMTNVCDNTRTETVI